MLPLEGLRAAAQATPRYAFRLEYAPGISYEDAIDSEAGLQHYVIGEADGGAPLIEVFREWRTGYARTIDSSAWIGVLGAPLPDLQRMALELVTAARDADVEEDQGIWTVVVRPQPFPPRVPSAR